MNTFRTRQPIGLGDLIRAAGALDAQPDELSAVAALLGLRPLLPKQAPMQVDDEPPPANEIGKPRPVEPPIPPPKPGAHVDPATSPPSSASGEYELVSAGRSRPSVPAWLAEAAVLDFPSDEPAYAATLPNLEPLLAPTRTRAILSAAAATLTSDGPIDIEHVIAELAQRRLPAALPRLSVETLRRGVQILVDRSPSMQPFRRDADDLAARLRQIASQGFSEVLYFDEDPELVDDTWPVRDGRAHRMPPCGVPIILITDLRLRSLSEARLYARAPWLRFAGAARRCRCPLLAFVPYPPHRWPSGLDGLITMLFWDRSTTVAWVRAARLARRR